LLSRYRLTVTPAWLPVPVSLTVKPVRFVVVMLELKAWNCNSGTFEVPGCCWEAVGFEGPATTLTVAAVAVAVLVAVGVLVAVLVAVLLAVFVAVAVALATVIVASLSGRPLNCAV